jgi:hypothetical protein
MENKGIKKLDQLNSVDNFFFRVARTIGLNNLIIQSITQNQSSKLGFLFLSIFLAWVVGNYTSHLLFTLILLFLALVYKTAIKFEDCDYDDLLSQYKERQKGEENSNQWSLKGLKKRSKWYLVTFIVLFAISLVQSPYIGVELTSKAIFAIAFGCGIATIIAMVLSEYTIGGLHRNRKLHYVLIVGLIAYSFGRYIFDYIG